jgi:excisionase family DNA binding protein
MFKQKIFVEIYRQFVYKNTNYICWEGTMAAPCKVWEEESISKQIEKLASKNLTIYQVARMLQVSHITVRRWIKEAKLIAWNTSLEGRGRWRVPKEALEEFLQSRSCMNID